MGDKGGARRSGHFNVIYEATRNSTPVVHTALRRALPDGAAFEALRVSGHTDALSATSRRRPSHGQNRANLTC